MRPRLALIAPRRARVEIIPLIDVVFFLLATFVLFCLSLSLTRALPVVLPQSGGEPGPEPVTIQITDGGAAYWNRELIPMSELPARLAQYKSQTDSPRVFITGDEKAKFGSMVTVMDEVNKAGIKNFSVETRTRPTGK